MSELIPTESIERRIVVTRGIKVLLDADLAALYEVEVGALNRAVKRNIERFPADFMFQLTEEEALRCQTGTLKKGRGQHRKYRPYAFTEQGVAMLSSVLRSDRAIQVNIAIMRAFVQMRTAMSSNAELARRLDDLEARYDAQFQGIFDAIRMLMTEPDKPSKRIGFQP